MPMGQLILELVADQVGLTMCLDYLLVGLLLLIVVAESSVVAVEEFFDCHSVDYLLGVLLLMELLLWVDWSLVLRFHWVHLLLDYLRHLLLTLCPSGRIRAVKLRTVLC